MTERLRRLPSLDPDRTPTESANPDLTRTESAFPARTQTGSAARTRRPDRRTIAGEPSRANLYRAFTPASTGFGPMTAIFHLLDQGLASLSQPRNRGGS